MENGRHATATPWVDLTDWDAAFLEIDVLNGTRFASLTVRCRVSYPHGSIDLRDRISQYCSQLGWHVSIG